MQANPEVQLNLLRLALELGTSNQAAQDALRRQVRRAHFEASSPAELDESLSVLLRKWERKGGRAAQNGGQPVSSSGKAHRSEAGAVSLDVRKDKKKDKSSKDEKKKKDKKDKRDKKRDKKKQHRADDAAEEEEAGAEDAVDEPEEPAGLTDDALAAALLASSDDEEEAAPGSAADAQPEATAAGSAATTGENASE